MNFDTSSNFDFGFNLQDIPNDYDSTITNDSTSLDLLTTFSDHSSFSVGWSQEDDLYIPGAVPPQYLGGCALTYGHPLHNDFMATFTPDRTPHYAPNSDLIESFQSPPPPDLLLDDAVPLFDSSINYQGSALPGAIDMFDAVKVSIAMEDMPTISPAKLQHSEETSIPTMQFSPVLSTLVQMDIDDKCTVQDLTKLSMEEDGKLECVDGFMSVAAQCSTRPLRRGPGRPTKASSRAASIGFAIPAPDGCPAMTTGALPQREAAATALSRFSESVSSFPDSPTIPPSECKLFSDDDDDDEYLGDEDEQEREFTPPSTNKNKRKAKTRHFKRARTTPRPVKCNQPGCTRTFTRQADVRRHCDSTHRILSNSEVYAETRKTRRLWCIGCKEILTRVDARRRHEGTCPNFRNRLRSL